MDKEYIETLIKKDIKTLGYDIWGIELVGSNLNPTLRIFIDNENGVTVEDCEKVSKHVSKVIEADDTYSINSTLEVSSPGIFRKLKTPDHFKSSTGKRIKVHFQKKIEGLMTVTGDLQKCDEETICILPDTNGSDMIIPYSLISRANLEPLLKF